ncbi:MAG: phosphoserine phosphatase SerB [Alphaproteobacteria bacterium]|nr:phosphoserine phosphatase SerB [Alphaproteobacteria bacterium]
MTNWILTLVAPADQVLTEKHIEQAVDHLPSSIIVDWLAPDRAADLRFESPSLTKADTKDIETDLLREFGNIDIAIQPDIATRRKKLLVADMDSTMIQLESLDYLAELLGFGNEVTEITNRGMRGELDFETSLKSRVSLLANQPTYAMATVLQNIPYTDGAEICVKTMRDNGCYCALVSGGFTFTTDVVAPKLGFHEARANRFEIIDGNLTGKVIEPILARDSKQKTMEELCKKFNLTSEEVCCIGDGANDLDMIRAAGMGVGYHGKPIVQEEAAFNIRFGDMTTLLFYQGYSLEEFTNIG